ncbi:MAG: DUF222 domain-containing protein [Propionibacteriales bacterium]|nr:DUF222 domain-containing protein [Propionibacteriales bacterium]
MLCNDLEVPIHAPAADVVVHVDANTLAAAVRESGAGIGHLDDGPGLDPLVLARLACDSRIQLSVHAPNGRTLDLGRRHRRPSSRHLAALWRRDRGCRMPGCDRTRFLHAHHVRAWARGGNTDMDNLILLCGEHHRLLHEGGFHIVALGKQRFRFHGQCGAERPTAPRIRGDVADLTAVHADVEPSTIESSWYGDPLDLDHAVSILLTNWENQAARKARVVET